MKFKDFYPRFTITDPYGRELEYNRVTGNRYTRTWLNNPLALSDDDATQFIPRLSYANALLDYIEQCVGHSANNHNPIGKPTSKKHQVSFDEWLMLDDED